MKYLECICNFFLFQCPVMYCQKLDTERPKKLITSPERRSLKSTTLNLIMRGHISSIILLIKHISKKVCFCQKGKKNAVKSLQEEIH